jgi:sporulation protein YlmC with PRC-barrel domain
MTTYEYIEQNIGKQVYVDGGRDLGFNGELKPIISKGEIQLTLIKLTKGGKAYLKAGDGKFYTVPASNVNVIDNKDEE